MKNHQKNTIYIYIFIDTLEPLKHVQSHCSFHKYFSISLKTATIIYTQFTHLHIEFVHEFAFFGFRSHVRKGRSTPIVAILNKELISSLPYIGFKKNSIRIGFPSLKLGRWVGFLPETRCPFRAPLNFQDTKRSGAGAAFLKLAIGLFVVRKRIRRFFFWGSEMKLILFPGKKHT